MGKKILGMILMILFLGIGSYAGVMFYTEYADAQESEATFEELQQMVTQPTESTSPDMGPIVDPTADEEVTDVPVENSTIFDNYRAMQEMNPDMVGWISIEGTAINYPVMHSLENPDYYLKHSFERSQSDYGVPYVDAACCIGTSNNLVIYGHNMKNGSMFHDLVQYKSQDFYEEHPIIFFDLIDSQGRYQVIAAFCYNTNSESFKYNKHVDMDEAEFAEYVASCKKRSIYDTGVTAEYGDQLITLSTCEYTYTNGRFVVVAKKIVE